MSTDSDIEGQTTRITRKGQVTIPKSFREEFGLEEGDELLWEKTDDGIRVRKATRSAGRGMLVEDDVPAETREKMAKEMEEELREKRRSEWEP
jgi:AbrB family looped-hinge helix DNA binding protein